MQLTREQLDWIIIHYWYPEKIYGDRGTLSPLHLEMESLGLIKVEVFRFLDAASRIVLTPTRLGHQTVAKGEAATVLCLWGSILHPGFVQEYIFPNITLSDLPQILACSSPFVRSLGNQLYEKVQCGRE